MSDGPPTPGAWARAALPTARRSQHVHRSCLPVVSSAEAPVVPASSTLSSRTSGTFFTKCQRVVLYQENVMWILPPSLQVKEKEKQFYSRKRKNKQEQKMWRQLRERVLQPRIPPQHLCSQSSSSKNRTFGNQILPLMCGRPDFLLWMFHTNHSYQSLLFWRACQLHFLSS